MWGKYNVLERSECCVLKCSHLCAASKIEFGAVLDLGGHWGKTKYLEADTLREGFVSFGSSFVITGKEFECKLRREKQRSCFNLISIPNISGCGSDPALLLNQSCLFCFVLLHFHGGSWGKRYMTFKKVVLLYFIFRKCVCFRNFMQVRTRRFVRSRILAKFQLIIKETFERAWKTFTTLANACNVEQREPSNSDTGQSALRGEWHSFLFPSVHQTNMHDDL